MKIVIRAGGNGTRLWPMSRQDNPKQFQKVVDDETMVRTTFRRVLPIVEDPGSIFLSINARFKSRARKEMPELPASNLIIETDARNTGPAICLEVCWLERKCRPEDVIATLPSDDFISNSSAFKDLLLSTEDFILNYPQYVVSPAIRPNYIDTGYSYFKAGESLVKNGGREGIYTITDVIEKPNYERCQELIDSGYIIAIPGCMSGNCRISLNYSNEGSQRCTGSARRW